MRTILLLVFGSLCGQLSAQTLYFPPTTGNTWETVSPASLNWCEDRVTELYSYLESTQTKGFIVLKDGKIALEKYFGTFTQDSLWYWASAGKTVTSFLVGKAQEEGFLNIQNKTSTYLGTGWSSLPTAKEDLITVRHQLTMTTGLDDGISNSDCTTKSCLQYKADAGTRWAYHNAPYTLLDKVIENAVQVNFNAYYTSKLKNTIGMNGLFIKTGDNNVLFSNARSMARFGLLISNEAKWGNTAVLSDNNYLQAMTTTSQSLNLSYGYLWWLNGKESFMAPTIQTVFQGKLMPDSPDDMYSAIGKNGQFINIIPSKGLVIIRMGNNANTSIVPFTYGNEIVKRVIALSCNVTAIEPDWRNAVKIYPTLLKDTRYLHIEGLNNTLFVASVFTIDKKRLVTVRNTTKIELKGLPNGVYFLHIRQEKEVLVRRFVID